MIRKILIMTAICAGLAACGGGSTKQTAESVRENGVEVLCFHGRQRCATCVAIERETKAVIDERFADAVASGALELRVIDIAQAENEAIADKYEITWSSLVVVGYGNGSEQAENLTEFAFANARSNPDAFRRGLTDKINEFLEAYGVAASNSGE